MIKKKSSHREISRLSLISLLSAIILLSSCFPSQGISVQGISPSDTPTPTPFSISIPKNVFFVDKKIGSDSNTGSQTEPWQTIQKAADSIDAGDTVIVIEGNYPERVQITRSGALEAPFTFQAEGQVIMHGFTVKADHITIKGFEITDTPDHEIDGVGIFIQGSHCDLASNYIHYATRGGITIFTDPESPTQTMNCKVQNNRLYNNAHHGIEVTGQNHLIEGNEIWGTIQYHPAWINPPSTADADGIRFFGSGHVFRRNYIHDISLNDPFNVDPHIDAFQTWDGTILEVGNNIIFEGNIVELPGEGTAGFQLGGAARNLIIRNNVVEAFAGIRGYANAGTPSNLTIVNNNFIGSLSYSPNQSPVGVTITEATNIIFKNNIIFNQKYKTFHISGQGNDVEFNLTYNSDGTMPPVPIGVSMANSLWGVNPLFINPGIMDYHLQAQSPAINAGALLVEVTNDLDGIARPQGGGVDIGSYEFTQ